MNFFITGGSRGIGAALVEHAVEEGHDVAFTYISNEAKAHEVAKKCAALRDGAIVRCYQLDVSDPAAVDSVMERVVEDFETLDVVVNNAGVTRDGLVMSMTNEEWNDVINTNLSGPFYVIRAALPILIANKYGRIINISSVVFSGATGQANYAASKSGMHGLTRSVAKEYGRKRITANSVVPGFFDTDMTREHMPDQVKSFWKTYAPIHKGRVGELRELTSVVMFLASDKAGFINGQEIMVTAGLDWTP
jgi:NAD(P)-dependent dehydrogenase (short-subunit alcohol dehydrogenase family)